MVAEVQLPVDLGSSTVLSFPEGDTAVTAASKETRRARRGNKRSRDADTDTAKTSNSDNVVDNTMVESLAQALPHTVLLEILLHCGPSELSSAAQVCHRWADACRAYDRPLWQRHVAAHWLRAESSSFSRSFGCSPHPSTWRSPSEYQAQFVAMSSKAEVADDDNNNGNNAYSNGRGGGNHEDLPLAEMYARWARRQAKHCASLDKLPPWAVRQLSVSAGAGSGQHPSSPYHTSGVDRPGFHSSQLQTGTGDYDILIKYLLVGDAGVGKSSFLTRFADDQFTSSYISTIGIDFKIKSIELDNTRVKMQMWDTAGQERFRTITSAYYRGAAAIWVCFDCTDRQSFENVEHWIKEIERYGSNPTIMLVATKCDLADRRVVSLEEAQALAEDLGVVATVMETSAKTGEGVEAAAYSMTECVMSGNSQWGLLPPSLPDARHFLRVACDFSGEEVDAAFPPASSRPSLLQRLASAWGRSGSKPKGESGGSSWSCTIV